MEITIISDGGSRGNPGPSAVGIVLKDSEGNILESLHKSIGFATNNEAEYEALIFGLETVKKYSPDSIICVSDSQLVIRHLSGEYQVTATSMIPLYKRAKLLLDDFSDYKLVWLSRKHMNEADKLVNRSLDGG